MYLLEILSKTTEKSVMMVIQCQETVVTSTARLRVAMIVQYSSYGEYQWTLLLSLSGTRLSERVLYGVLLLLVSRSVEME